MKQHPSEGPVLVSCADYIACRPGPLRSIVADPGSWRICWPELGLTPTGDRPQNLTWRVDGAELGTAEWYLEPLGHGVVVHWFLRVMPAPTRLRRWWQRRRLERVAAGYRRRIWELKDHCERHYPSRPPCG